MKKTLLSTTAMILVAGALSAQSIADQVITALQAEGYERIEIDNSPSTIKVEAIRGDRKLEIIYDAITGEILKQESGPVEAREERAPGVFIDFDDDDDERDDDERDDDERDDDERDDDERDDDERDDDERDDDERDDDERDDDERDDDERDDDESDDEDDR